MSVTVRKLIESVAEVCGERDMDQLRRSLLLTLNEVLPVTAAGFVPLKPGGRDVCDPAEAFPWRLAQSGDHDDFLARLAAGETLMLPQPGGASCLMARAVSDDQAMVVQLQHPEPDAENILGALGRLYANFSGLLLLSERDRLTGLRNRRSFDLHLERLTERALAPDAPGQAWWLARFDVDHFKRINDGYGHLYGDEVLLLLSRLTREALRAEDRCFRYGGEEFAVLLACSDDAAATLVLERLRQRVEAFAFPQVGRVTISIGYAGLQPRLGASDLIGRSDRALYAAKHAGRNRVISYERLIAEHHIDPAPKSGTIELF